LRASATVDGSATLQATGEVVRAKQTQKQKQKKVARMLVSFRLEPQLRDRLVAETLESGRSLAQTIEDRLRQSFEAPDLLGKIVLMLHEQRQFLNAKFPDEATKEAA
jgi:hypothetical protein